MVKYECYRCGLISKQRSNFKRHLNRKHICNPIKNNISTEEIKEKYGFKNVNPMSTLCQPNVNPIPVLKKKNVNPMSTLCQPNVNPSPKNFCKKKSSKIYTCEFCNKDFEKRQGKYKHMKNHCKVKIESKNKKEYWRKLFEQSEKKREQKKFLILQ